jgi:hypothetical protein
VDFHFLFCVLEEGVVLGGMELIVPIDRPIIRLWGLHILLFWTDIGIFSRETVSTTLPSDAVRSECAGSEEFMMRMNGWQGMENTAHHKNFARFNGKIGVSPTDDPPIIEAGFAGEILVNTFKI